jgi:hypothetical protein
MFKSIYNSVAQGIMALLGVADVVHFGEVFNEEGTKFGLRNGKKELRI